MVRLIALAALTLVLATTPARADDDRRTEAQRHFEGGMAHFHLEEYDKAIEAWEEGYRIKPAPQFLYNIAQAYRLSRRPEKALTFYQKYLRLEPKARNRAECERHIALLTPIVEQQRRASEQPSTQPMTLEPAPASPTAPSPATTPPTTPPSTTVPAGADLSASAAPRDKPVYKKGWFWGVVAGGAVLVAGAVTLGVVLGTRGASENTLPAARFN
jgi:tetratricopeptide (TPR) repeat protein